MYEEIKAHVRYEDNGRYSQAETSRKKWTYQRKPRNKHAIDLGADDNARSHSGVLARTKISKETGQHIIARMYFRTLLYRIATDPEYKRALREETGETSGKELRWIRKQ